MSDTTVLVPVDSIELIEIRPAYEHEFRNRDVYLNESQVRQRYSTIHVQTKHGKYQGVVTMPCEELEKLLYDKIADRSVIKLHAKSVY